MACQRQEARFAHPGETVTFSRGTPHRFWNEGEDLLICKAWISPPLSIVFFRDAVYAAVNKSGTECPEAFDAAWLLTRYASEYDLPEIPVFARKVIMPVLVFLGRIMGKYPHFNMAPKPVPPVH